MAPSMLRCPHCNAPLTRVDGKDPTECPYCRAMLTSQGTSSAPRPAGRNPAAALVGVVVAMVLAVGLGVAAFLRAATPPPVEQPSVVAEPPPRKPMTRLPPPAPPSPVKEVLAFGEEGTNPGQLDSPSHLAVASDGSIIVAERGGRLQRFGPDGAYQATVVMPPDKLTKQNGIFGLATDASGKIYVNRVGDVLVYDAARLEVVRTLLGDYPDRYYHGGLAVDGTGNVYSLTDRTGDVDLVITSPTGKILSRRRAEATGVAVDGSGAKVFLLHGDGLEVQDAKGGVLAKVGGLGGSSLAFDGKGHVFVATGSSVEVLSPEGARLLTLPVTTATLALDRAGRLYALERHGVKVYEVTLP